MGAVSLRVMRAVFAVTATVLVVATAGCSLPEPETAPAPLGSSFAPAGTAAAGLVDLGWVGQDQGRSEQVRTAAAALQQAGRTVTAALEDAAARAGVPLDMSSPPDLTALLGDLTARTGDDFDPAWTRAALDQIARTRTAVEALLADAAVPEDIKTVIREAIAGLDIAGDTTAPADTATGGLPPAVAGALPPTVVDAGDGGWLSAGPDAPSWTAWLPVAGGVLLGLGAAMFGTATLGGIAARRRERR